MEKEILKSLFKSGINNLFSKIPEYSDNEITEVIFCNDLIRIERIVSYGFASPENFWYNQDSDEWVILLEGNASIEFKNDEIIDMKKGDYIFIPANREHRVKYCSKEPNCLWLAVHFNFKKQ